MARLSSVFAIPSGFVLGERFRIESFVGASENARNYLATDLVRGDRVRVKEFFPKDASRSPDGFVELGPNAARRRSILLEEGRRQARVAHLRTIGLRATLAENGTVYRIRADVPGERVADWDRTSALRLVEFLEPMHRCDDYHLNLKESNVLREGDGFVLVDSLSPLAWERDTSMADSNEAIDVRALARMFRAAGLIDEGPTYRLSELRDRLRVEPARPPRSAFELDEALDRSRRVRIDPYECPSCGDPLRRASALGAHVCPVCREGTIRRRKWTPQLCPVCRAGKTSVVANSGPLEVCPICAQGRLERQTRGILRRETIARCRQCYAAFTIVPGGMALARTDGAPDEVADFETWRRRSGRSASVVVCAQCPAVFDVLADARRRLIYPEPATATPPYDEQEWMRIAHGFGPVAGDAACDRCGADFNLTDDSITLMSADFDLFGFARDYRWRTLDRTVARWLGDGKRSPHSGVVCDRCRTEFDFEGREWTLIDSTHDRLARRLGHTAVRADWKRIALDLPSSAEFEALSDQVRAKLRDEFREGRRAAIANGGAQWRGKVNDESGAVRRAAFDSKEWVIGGTLRKRRTPLRDVMVLAWTTDEIVLDLEGDVRRLRVEPVEMTVPMRCGTWSLTLRADDVAICLDAWSMRARDVQGYA